MTANPDTVVELEERYFRFLAAERNLSRFTLRNYRSDLEHLMSWLEHEGIVPLAITRLQFRAYLATMIEAGTARGSIVRRTSTARSFYRWLRREGIMQDDPLANVRGAHRPRRLPHALTQEDVTAMIAAAEGDDPSAVRDRALLEILYACGLRVSETHALDIGHVDTEQRTVRVRGKGNKERLVLMGEPARRALLTYMREARPRLLRKRAVRTVAGGRALGRELEALFVNRSGGRLSQRSIQLIVRRHALAAGVAERVHPHLLRHTFATHLLDGGAELRVVQELLGHANPNTTQIYLHVTEERQRKVVEQSLEGIGRVEEARRALGRGRGRRHDDGARR
jgi:site-specific recombinase XerD